jgi:hypothetical protein
MTTTKSLALVVATLAASLVAERAASACGTPAEYATRVDGSTVTVCPLYASPSRAPLLRQDTATGDVVQVAELHGDAGTATHTCYIDECVAPGTYRYGFAVPYECCPECAWTLYYGTATVTAPISGCQRGPDDPGPSDAGVTAPPWTDAGEYVCQTQCAGPDGVDADAPDSADISGDAGEPIATATSDAGSGSCSFAPSGAGASGGVAALVLALAGAFGLRGRAKRGS